MYPQVSEQPTLQSRLEEDRRRTTPSPITDPADLFLELESEGKLHRDRGIGRIYHLGGVSFREKEPANSLHISVHGNRLAAHVDRVSPLATSGGRAPRYSLRRAVTHNLAGMTHDLVRLLRGRQGDHRCALNCEWVPDVSASEPDEDDLLDPTASSWSVHLEACVAGALDEGRLRAAFSTVLGDTEECPVEVVDCPDDASLDGARRRLAGEVVWSSRNPPLRAYLARHPDGDVLMLNVNHAAADGFGALRVLDCIARAYADGIEPAPPLDFLATRTVPIHPAAGPRSQWVRAYQTVVQRIRDTLGRPARLVPDQAAEEPGYGFHLVSLSAEETSDLVDLDQPDVTANRLIAALHRAIGEWNLERGAPGRQIGVLIPINLRPDEWPEAKIGNFSVTARVSTNRWHRRSPAAALKAVTAQTIRNRRTRTGVALIAALQRLGLLPLWAKQSLVVLQPLTGNTQVDTALLAHLGSLANAPAFGPDPAETVGLWFSVPARTPLALCVGTVVVAGRLHLTFRYPRRLFSPDGARRFADCYVANLRGEG